MDVQIPPRRSFKTMAGKVDHELSNISEFRIRMRGHFKYLTVDASRFRENLRRSDFYHLPRLLHDPENNWTSAHIVIRQDYSYYYKPGLRLYPTKPLFDITYFYKFLETAQRVEDWDKPDISVSTLMIYNDFSDEYQIAVYDSAPTGLAVARYMPFESDIARLEQELSIYHKLDTTNISPKFFGYLIEDEERVVGYLRENTYTRPLLQEDMPRCKEVLEHLHAQGIALGNLTEYSFLFTADRVVLHEFTQIKLDAPKEVLEEELESFEELFRNIHSTPSPRSPSPVEHHMEIDYREENTAIASDVNIEDTSSKPEQSEPEPEPSA